MFNSVDFLLSDGPSSTIISPTYNSPQRVDPHLAQVINFGNCLRRKDRLQTHSAGLSAQNCTTRAFNFPKSVTAIGS